MSFRTVPKFYEVEKGVYSGAIEQKPFKAGNKERPALEPMIMALHAKDKVEKGKDVEYNISRDCRKVNVVWDEEPEKYNSIWRLGYSTAVKPENRETVINMKFRPKNEPSENPGSKAWEDIIWTLQDRTQKYYNQLEQRS